MGLAIILTACRTDDAADYGRNPDNGIVFKLQYDGYDNETTRSATPVSYTHLTLPTSDLV